MPVRREIEVKAPPEDVWEALIDEDRRADWLDEPGRAVDVEVVEAPSRLVWWWSSGARDEEVLTRVEVLVEAVGSGSSRVVVVESVPAFPLPALAMAFVGAPA